MFWFVIVPILNNPGYIAMMKFRGVKTKGRQILHYVLIGMIAGLGGLISGLIIYTIAPEAEGADTDAAIDAYHNKGGIMRGRVSFIKTLASAITITSGGSGGKEGPIIQIGASFVFFLSMIYGVSCSLSTSMTLCSWKTLPFQTSSPQIPQRIWTRS